MSRSEEKAGCGPCGTKPCAEKCDGKVAPLAEIHSVHVAELDEEHEECAAALGEFARAPTRSAILGVLAAYVKHFQHEEEMLDKYLYANVSSEEGFSAAASARRSHFADHERMIEELRAQVRTVGDGTAPAAFVDRVLRSFEQHANVYDANYSEPLSAQLAAA